MKRAGRVVLAAGLVAGMAAGVGAQERRLSRCPHGYCPHLRPWVAGGSPVVVCTGSHVQVCAELDQWPGCYEGHNIYFGVAESNWTWRVEGVEAQPRSGRGSCAVFTNVGTGYGYLIFTVSSHLSRGRWWHCEDEEKAFVALHSHALSLDLQPTNYLPLDGFDPPEHEEHSVTAVAELVPERSDCEYEWELEGVCQFAPGWESNSRIILERDEPSGSYQAERVRVRKVCRREECFTVVKVDVDAGLPEEQEEKEGFYVVVNDNDSDASGRADMEEQSLAEADPDLVPITISVTPTNLPGSEMVEVDGGPLYEDAYKRQVAASTYMVSELPKTLYVEGVAVSEELRDHEIVVRHSASGARDRVKYTVLKVDIAMDGNRDDDINFDDPDDARYLFWVNDDYDLKHHDEGMWQQDDANPATHRDCDDNYIGNSQASGEHACERDLEDFTRLHIRVDDITANLLGITYWLKFENVTSGSPAVNVFKAVNTTTEYLSKPAVAADQIQEQNLTPSGVGATEVQIEAQYIKTGNQVSPFIIEGRSAGKGNLTFIVKKDGKEICRKAVALELHDMRWFYDIYTVGVTSGDRWEVQIATTATHSQSASYTPATNEKLLLVHGWNMNAAEKTAWVETVFKRLWWQGYQGSVALFDWPTLSDMNFWDILAGARHFDNSEFLSWLSSEALIGVFNTLNGSGNLRVLAHSMGNIVVGEALRRYTGANLHTYVACQAALSAQYYDNTIAAYHPCVDRGYDLFFPNTPDIMGHFSTGDANSNPYMMDNDTHVSNMHNFFNALDWALALWEINNVLKPDNWAPYFFDYVGSEERYRESSDQFSRGPIDNPYEVLSVTNQRQRYMIFSYCDESRSQALGQTENREFANWNLELDPAQGGMGYDGHHYSHSREFRSNIADEWEFWKRVFGTCQFQRP